MREAIRKELEKSDFEYLLLWFRRKYDLPLNDPRFLSATRQQIIYDYLSHQEFEKIEDEERRKAIDESQPLCPECKYRGQPERGQFCPRCGMQMEIGDVYYDPDFDEYLKGLGISKEDIK